MTYFAIASVQVRLMRTAKTALAQLHKEAGVIGTLIIAYPDAKDRGKFKKVMYVKFIPC